MDTQKIDILNIFLILISLVLAYFLPFELFLFSYAVLGPLHYATEISWLDKKNYFINTKKWILLFLIFCVINSIPSVLSLSYFSPINEIPFLKKGITAISSYQNNIVLVTFLMSIGLIYIQKLKTILIYLFFCIAISNFILNQFSFSAVIVGVFLPTIIHVYLFTLLFMIFGTMASKSKFGIMAIILMILCPFLVVLLNINPESYHFTSTVKEYFTATGMTSLNYYIALVLNAVKDDHFALASAIGIKIQIFVAFCYTYHYLNWFSKTSLIGWNKNISKKRILIILIIWISSVVLYWYNFKVGLTALFFLSMLHVFLEFPLNINTIKAILKRFILPEDKEKIIIKK